MTEQQFLRQIKRLLHCKADKKREILRQLESDIASAKEGGKSWEEIRQEWGTPEQFVSEFNEDGRSIQKGKESYWQRGSACFICLCGGRCLVCTLARKKQRAAVDKEC
ncbi:MAG: HAAS signaling domain-containing protein [Clostridium sp.]